MVDFEQPYWPIKDHHALHRAHSFGGAYAVSQLSSSCGFFSNQPSLFLADQSNLKDLPQEDHWLVRDGSNLLKLFFKRLPRPPPNLTTHFLIHRSLRSIIPKPWLRLTRPYCIKTSRWSKLSLPHRNHRSRAFLITDLLDQNSIRKPAVQESRIDAAITALRLFDSKAKRILAFSYIADSQGASDHLRNALRLRFAKLEIELQWIGSRILTQCLHPGEFVFFRVEECNWVADDWISHAAYAAGGIALNPDKYGQDGRFFRLSPYHGYEIYDKWE